MFHSFWVRELPDFLSDYALPGETAEERLRSHWRRWVQAIGTLWDPRRVYALCFHWRPEQKAITIYGCEKNESETALLPLAFEAVGVHSECKDFGNYSALFAQMQSVCLVAQDEVSIELSETIARATKKPDLPLEFCQGKDGIKTVYESRPWWGPGGEYLAPFRLLTKLRTPASLCILLQPRPINKDVLEKISAMARECASFAQYQTPAQREAGQPVGTGRPLIDPQLSWAGRIYAAILRRLTTPWLVVTACFATSQQAAEQLARSLANTLREEICYDPPFGETVPLPSASRVLSVSSKATESVVRMFQDLQIDEELLCTSSALDCDTSWGQLSLTHQQGARDNRASRNSLLPYLLRYLVDARGAAAVFRFPVSINSGIPKIRVRQRPPEFHPGTLGDRDRNWESVSIGFLSDGTEVNIDLQALAKHVLIVGTTGSGKTNTALSFLYQLYTNQIPFLVIESAKQEYRELTQIEPFRGKLRVYTLGNELCSPVRLNPFQLLPGVRVEAHISRLQTCFEAALPQDIGAISSILSEALHMVYARHGWRDVEVYFSEDPRSFPTMEDFVAIVESIINQRYVGEIQANMSGALLGRLKPLLLGSKRRTFNVEQSEPDFDTLMNVPVVLELNDLNLEEKALVTLFLLTFLREYCDQNRRGAQGLQHVTLIEEAHNVLEQTTSVGAGQGVGKADTRYKAVQTICQMLAEIRVYGEGIIIVDQSPTKLARDAIRNTNLQITHALRDAADREAIASAMIMDDVQSDYIGKLRVGEAAIFFPGMEKATFIKVHPMENFAVVDTGKTSSDEEIRKYMASISALAKPTPFAGCEYCKQRCVYREQARDYLIRGGRDFLKEIRSKAERNAQSPQQMSDANRSLLRSIIEQLRTDNPSISDVDFCWCVVVQYESEGHQTWRRRPLRRSLETMWREIHERGT